MDARKDSAQSMNLFSLRSCATTAQKRSSVRYARWAGLICLVFSGVASADLYRWTTQDGVVHYGDNMPSAQAIHGYDIIDPITGDVIRHIHREKTPQELAAEAAAKAAAEKKQAKKAAEARHDRILLDLYSNTSDIDRERDRRLKGIDKELEQAQKALTAKTMLLKQAESTAQQQAAFKSIQQIQQRLFDLRQARAQIVEQFAKDKRRFEQLKAGQSDQASP